MKKLIIILGPLLVLGVPLLLWWQFGNKLQQSTVPVTREEAQRKCPIPFPPGAKNVQYSIYTSGPVFQCYIRYEASVEECLAAADEIFHFHATQTKTDYTAPKVIPITPVTHGAPPAGAPHPGMNIGWFDIAQIQDGIAAGERAPWHPQVWVDKDRGVFYYYLSD